jgi:hypothetical protein
LTTLRGEEKKEHPNGIQTIPGFPFRTFVVANSTTLGCATLNIQTIPNFVKRA